MSSTTDRVVPAPTRWGGEALQWTLFGLMSGVWGSSYLWTKLALRSFDPSTIVALRMGIAALVLGAIVAARRVRLPRRARDYRTLAALSLVNVTIPFTMITWGQQYINTSLTAVLSSTTPLFVFAITSLSGRDERFSWPRLAGTCVAFAGIMYLTYGSEHHQPGGSSLVGAGAVLGSSIVFAAGNVFSRRVTRAHPPLAVAFVQSASGCLFELPVIAAMGRWHVQPAGSLPIVAIVWLGVAGSALTYVLYFHFIRTWGSTRTSLNTYFQPVVGVGLGVLVLDESLSVASIVGLLITAAGVAIFLWGTFRQPGKEP